MQNSTSANTAKDFIPELELIICVLDIKRGYQYIRGLEITHGDIKSNNIKIADIVLSSGDGEKIPTPVVQILILRKTKFWTLSE